MNLFEGNVYYFKEKGREILGLYLCRTIKKKTYYFIPLEDTLTGTYYRLTSLKKYAIISDLKEVHFSKITRSLYIKGKPAAVTNDDFVSCYIELLRFKLDKERTKIESTIPKTFPKTDLVDFFEESMKFVNWQNEKFELSFNTSNSMSVFENGVYWTDFGYNIGTELNKQRPAIVWKKILNNTDPGQNSYICIPLTSKTNGKAYYYNVPITIDGIIYYAKVNDMKRVNQNRIKRPRKDHHNSIHYISHDERDKIKDAIKTYYVF